MKYTTEEKEVAKIRLQVVLKPASIVYTILRHCSSSGMSRIIDLLTLSIDEEGKPQIEHIGYSAAVLLDEKYDTSKQGIKISGCGMDMGFHLVYSLSSALFGRNEEAEKYNHITHRNGSEKPENDGGYFLKHYWL